MRKVANMPRGQCFCICCEDGLDATTICTQDAGQMFEQWPGCPFDKQSKRRSMKQKKQNVQGAVAKPCVKMNGWTVEFGRTGRDLVITLKKIELVWGQYRKVNTVSAGVTDRWLHVGCRC